MVDAVLQIPNCGVLLARPRVRDVIMRFVDGSSDRAKKIEEGEPGIDETQESGGCGIMREGSDLESHETHSLGHAAAGSGLAVCASGPQELTREAANVMARLSASSGS